MKIGCHFDIRFLLFWQGMAAKDRKFAINSGHEVFSQVGLIKLYGRKKNIAYTEAGFATHS